MSITTVSFTSGRLDLTVGFGCLGSVHLSILLGALALLSDENVISGLLDLAGSFPGFQLLGSVDVCVLHRGFGWSSSIREVERDRFEDA
jgi:hypothetical protein